MRWWWQLLMVGGIAVGVTAVAEYLARRQKETRDGRDVHPWPGEAPANEVIGWRPAVFFDLSEPEQLWVLMELIRETGACAEIEAEALRTGRTERLHELLVTLLGIKDPRMDLPRTEGPAADGRDAVRVERRARHRVDDSLFKDNLLYMLRDRLAPDSPLLDGIVRAYDRDEEPYNRARIVRAVGLIGGARARTFLERVVHEEAHYRSLASREARKFLVAP
jgi:hypothetical protein